MIRGLMLAFVLVFPAAQMSAEETPATEQAVRQIQLQADRLADVRPGLSRAYVTALAIMNHVQSRVSSLNYSLRSTAGEKLPTSVEECLQMEAGICGNHIAVFLEIATRLKLRSRPVEFYFHGDTPAQNHSHICVEVFYREKWRLLDVTWGTYYRLPVGPGDNLASIDEVRASLRSRRWAVTNESDLWYRQWKASGLDPLEYVDHEKVDILRGRRGTIRLSPQSKSVGVEYAPIHQPGYLGRNEKNKDYGPISLELIRGDVVPKLLRLHVRGLVGRGQLVVAAGERGGQVATPLVQLKAGKVIQVNLEGLKLSAGQSLTIRVDAESADEIAYVVYSQIDVLAHETTVPRDQN